MRKYWEKIGGWIEQIMRKHLKNFEHLLSKYIPSAPMVKNVSNQKKKKKRKEKDATLKNHLFEIYNFVF